MSDGAVARALVLQAPRSLVVREFPVPAIGEDDALVRVEACGLCGTDHEQYTGQLAGGFAFVPGHETVGTIEAIGPQAAQRWGVSAGDRVAVELFQSCRQCPNCLVGEYRRCARHGLADKYGFIPVDRESGLWGGYAEFQYLAPDSMVLPVAGDLSPEVATLFNPLGAGIRWGGTVPETSPGDVVAVLGPGIRGLCAAAAAKEAGAGFVMVTGLGPRDAGRLALASQFGADLAVDVAVDDPVAALTKETGGLADVVIDVTAKAPAAFAQAIALARPAGTVVVAGTRGFGSGAPGFSSDVVVFKELRVIGALGVDATAYRRCARPDDAEDLLATMAGERDGVPPVHGVLTP
jgi:alcohol dehydrogenase